MVFIMGGCGHFGMSVVACVGCIYIIETAKFFDVAGGRLAWKNLLFVFEVEISISVEVCGGVIMVGLVGYNSTYLLRIWYLTRLSFLFRSF